MQASRPRPSRAAKTKAAALVVDSDFDSDGKEALQAKQKSKAPQKRRKPSAAAAGQHEDEPKPAAKPQRKKKKAAVSSDDEEAPKPKPNRKKKKQQDERTDADGKTVRYRESASMAVTERIKRTMPGSGHRMFLVDSKEPVGAAGSQSQEFAVMGATGNVYDIKISRNPHCSCPDHAKGNVCKHILFVMLRVLKLESDNPIIWQKALLASEVEEALSARQSQGGDLAGVMADERVRGAYWAATGGAAGGAAGAGDDKRKPIEGDCPICFDELKAGGEALVWCKGGCGNNMHKKCWDVWAATKRRSRVAVTCVYCRAPWLGEAPAAAASPDDDEGGYINLALHSAAHAGADTSLEALYGHKRAHWINFHRRGY